MADLLYPQGSLRYFFFHGNHGDVPIPETVTVEAKIVAFTGQGQILFGENFENNPSVYHFTNGVYKGDGQNERPLPASHFTERLLKNVSVPTLVLAETPNHCMGNDFETPDPFIYIAVLVCGRSDLRPCTADDREYVGSMMRNFLPRLMRSLAPIASEYLPGDVHNLRVDIANRMESFECDPDFDGFIALYRSRYVPKSLPQRAVAELCLLHVLKMPFELSLSIRSSLIRY